MKKLGVIGGAGPLASALLYETLVHESYRQGVKIPEIYLINFPFTRGLTRQEGEENQKILFDELTYCISNLTKQGVEIAILACNTLHLFLKKLPPHPIFFYSLPELVVKAAHQLKHNRLLLLGTENTRHSNLYGMEGIEIFYPSLGEQKLIEEVIDRILDGKILQEDSFLISYLIQQMRNEKDFDGIVLGCTDLPVLHHRFPFSSNIMIYDSIKIPAQTLIGLL